ncbi:MAG TPA: cytochrome c3 family protein [Geobacteraceae bacterium]
MKKTLSLLAAVALVAVASTAMASTISATKHNLSSGNVSGFNNGANLKGTGTQICVYCHTPHNAYTSAPLWNRNAGVIGAGSYTLYSGVGMSNVSYKSGFTADSISLFCMSCHDGSALGGTMIKNVPISEPAGLGNSAAIGTTSKANLTAGGTDLRTTHPVNFPVTQNTQLDLQPIAAPFMGKAGGVQYPLFKSSRSGGVANSLECSSCHSVHDNANAPFLRDTQTGSTLCLGCHNK